MPPLPAAATTLKTVTPSFGAGAPPPAPAGGDVVSQMKTYLQKQGYTPPAPQAPSASGDWYSQVQSARKESNDTYLNRVNTTMQKGRDIVSNAFETGGENVMSDFEKLQQKNAAAPAGDKALNDAVFAGHTAGNIAGTAMNVGLGALKAFIAPISQAKTAQGETFGDTFGEPLKAKMHEVAQAFVDTGNKNHSDVMAWWHSLDPDVKTSVADVLNTTSLLGGGKILGAPIGTPGEVVDTLKSTASDIADTTSNAVSKTAKTVASPIKAIQESTPIESMRAKLGDHNSASGLESSANRLAENAAPGGEYEKGMGAAIRVKPIDVYDSAARDSAAHLKDPTIVDKPTENFGKNDISKAFDEVIQKRKAFGDTMSSELEKVGGVKTDITTAKQNLLETLSKEQKLTYDKGELTAKGQSPMGVGDRKMVETYLNDLETLGHKPTVSDVDAFVKRTTSDLDLYKAKNQIMGTTNGERLIKNNLKSLRNAISPEGTGNKSLKGYADAKAEYARLSKGVESGIPLLGKKSLGGGYIRDAAVAKRAIQSLSDGGSKDFLRFLEKETGRPLLDKAFVILQAEKDAGITTAHSLLDMFSKDRSLNIPGSGSLGSRLFDWSAKHLAGRATGTAAEQTRAFLKSLEQKLEAKQAAEEASQEAKSAAESSAKTSIADKAKTLFDKIKNEGKGGFVKIPGIDKPVPNPDVVAKEVTAADFKAIQDYMNIRGDNATAFVPPSEGIALDEAMERLGLQKFSSKAKPLFPTEQSKLIYLKQVIKHYNDQGSEGSIIKGAAKKYTPSTKKK